MRFALLSDLHVSRYGDHADIGAKARFYLPKLPGQVKDRGVFWRTEREIDGWKIQVNRVDRHRRVLDPQGIRRGTIKQELEHLVAQVSVWRKADCHVLAERGVSGEELRQLLSVDPDNTNLRLLQISSRLSEMTSAVDWLVLPGDLTDNGYGYELIHAAFKPWFERSRVVVAPGNHDLNKILVSPLGYQFKMEVETTSRSEKEARFWSWYQKTTARTPFPSGCSEPIRDDSEGVVFVCLDSVADASQRVAFEAAGNAVGEVSEHAMLRLRDIVHAERRRSPSVTIVVVLHHHILWQGLARDLKFEKQMSVRNGEQVWSLVKALDIDVVANGHRHYSYDWRDPIHGVRLLSSPSGADTTLHRYRGMRRADSGA